MKIISRIVKFFKNLLKKSEKVEEVHKPMNKETMKKVPKNLRKDRAFAKGEVISLEDELNRLKQDMQVEEEIDMKQQALEKQKEKMWKVIEEGEHTEYDGEYYVIGRTMKPLGKLISIIEYKGGTYFYIKKFDGKHTLYGDRNTTRKQSIHYYENLHEQMNIDSEGIDGILAINYEKGDKKQLIPDHYLVLNAQNN